MFSLTPAPLPEGEGFIVLRRIGDFVERRPALASLALVALTVLTHIVILVAPGFFAGDEWQRFDHVHTHGFWHFAQAYGVPDAGQEFGYPVRPLGFLQQGVAALWMQSAPWASHLIGILNHALVAITFVWVLRRAGVTSATAALAGVFFVLSPLTTVTTGWIAASFDQLYVLFLLLAAAAIVRLPIDGASLRKAVWIVLATAAALLSKETAVVAPAAVVLLGYLAWAAHPAQFSWRPFAVALLLVLIPTVAYLLFRAPSIANTFAGNATEAYAPNPSKIPSNAFRYFAYPFRLKVVELSDGVFGSLWQPAAATFIHLLLVSAVYWLFGLAFALAYVVGYFLFLVPVLPLPIASPHYLYGSGLAMSLAIAAVLARLLVARRARLAVLLVAGVAGLYAHNLAIQMRLYETARCQSAFLESVDALLAQAASEGPRTIRVIPDYLAPMRVAIRAVSYRERYTANGVVLVAFERTERANALPTGPDVIRARMTTACTLVPERE
jgi:hypothetical protein